jgi:hypothetical protein
MINLPEPVDVDQAAAREWLCYSLGQGDVISPALLKMVEGRRGRSYVLAPSGTDPGQLASFEHGVIGTGPKAARVALASVLDAMIGRGAACVVVEDELRLKRDPKPSVDGLLHTAFVGERVIHWAALAGGTESAILTLHRGSSGYPLNAFVTSASEQDLCLVDGADLDQGIGSAVAQSILAVIVAAYDAASFLIWEPTTSALEA